ncbi:sensor domain-containing diguanylate cyclase [Maridesulfovibrio ferrireducens]|uniref:sensor domain-containing diguanylate cyclase n=1 Tax=Maridesulfovibrio ferrireducens TaxID=246191 RepID=UPI001A1B3EA8|nr:sensor domain-containing diguanylate cyclase [Maridesulfovibrio ferrireducens]MBI9111881.1 GGDEF domain-containing protein [Maridesulfovibrio ferrireducens]
MCSFCRLPFVICKAVFWAVFIVVLSGMYNYALAADLPAKSDVSVWLWCALSVQFLLILILVGYLYCRRNSEIFFRTMLKGLNNKVSKQNLELQTALDEWRTIYDNSQVGIAVLKGGRFFARGNKRLADILGYDSPEEMQGLSLRAAHLTEKRYHDFGKKYFDVLAHGSYLHIEYQLARKDGSPVWCMLSGKAIDPVIPADLNKGVIWIIDDISKQKQMEEELRMLAGTDVLTGLYNRRQFMELANIEYQRHCRYGEPLAFIMGDLDHFKRINDTYGHESGDLVLKSFADLCKEQFREVDIIGRLGGEEFAILLPSTTLDEAAAVAERLRRVCQERDVFLEEGSLRVTVSLGVAMADKALGLKSLIRRADEAMYRAKSESRNRVGVQVES